MKHATFVDVGRKIFHLFIKSTNEDRYYTSLQALFDHNENVGISKFTLDRYNFKEPYENLLVVIKKGEALGTGDVEKAAKPKKPKPSK